jgi:hypothetical protein
MDVYEAIRDLRKERDRLDATIAALEVRVKWERQQKSGKEKGRRGRKTMSPEERLQVSERMRRYWAARRGNATS